jgi:hypothetical protein
VGCVPSRVAMVSPVNEFRRIVPVTNALAGSARVVVASPTVSVGE